MIYENYIRGDKKAFLTKLEQIAAKLKIEPEWLMGVMYKESKVNPAAVNSISGATGLIQFMPTTASRLGTNTTALKNMSSVNQLEYVYQYFKPYAGKIKSFTDLYLATFFPAALGKPGFTVLETKNISAGTIAKQNKIFDLNKNNKITINEFKRAILADAPAELKSSLTILGAVFFFGLSFLIYRQFKK